LTSDAVTSWLEQLAPQMQGREKKEEMIDNGKTILYAIV
jgi:hypothetical protein